MVADSFAINHHNFRNEVKGMNNVYFCNKEISELIVRLSCEFDLLERRLSPSEYKRMFKALNIVIPKEIKNIRDVFQTYGVSDEEDDDETRDDMDYNVDDRIILQPDETCNNIGYDVDDRIIPSPSESNPKVQFTTINVGDETINIPKELTPPQNPYGPINPYGYMVNNSMDMPDPVIRPRKMMLSDALLVDIIKRLKNGDTPEEIEKEHSSDQFVIAGSIYESRQVTAEYIRLIDERVKFAGPNAVLWITTPIRCEGRTFHSFIVHPFIKEFWNCTIPKKYWKFDPFMYDDGGDKPLQKHIKPNKNEVEKLIDILRSSESDKKEIDDIIKESSDLIDNNIFPSSN